MPLGRIVQEDFRVGVQRDFAPHLMDPRSLWEGRNSLLNDDGSVYKRGGSVSVSAAPLGSAGRQVWEGWLLPGRRTLMASNADFAVLEEDGETLLNLGGAGFPTVIRPMAVLQDLLFIGGGTIYGGSRMAADYSTGKAKVTNGSATVTGVGTEWKASVDPGMLFRVGTDRIYVVSQVTSDTELVLRDAYEGVTEEVAYTLKRLEEASGVYRSAQIYAIVGRRLVACAGNQVFLSEPDKPHLWQAKIPPEETVVQNLHDLEEGAQILGAESIGVDRLHVFTTRGLTSISNLALSIVDGLGNPQHRIEKLGGDILWGTGSGIASYAGELVVPTVDGIFLFGPSGQTNDIGGDILPLVRQHVNEGNVPGGAWVAHNHYFLPIVSATGAPLTLLICRLDRPVRTSAGLRWPWTTADGAGARVSGGAVRAPSGASDLPKVLAACDDGNLIDLATYFAPSTAVKNDHDGTTAIWIVVTRDFSAGNLGISRFRRLRMLYELEAAAGDEPTIQAEVGLGIRKAMPLWDEVTWDDFEWGDPEETEFTLLPGAAIPNAGAVSVLAQNAWVWYFAQTARYTRYRLVCSDPVAKLTLRTLEIFVAQAGGVRKAKVK